MSDPQYRTFDYRFQNGGVIARDVYDKMRPGSYRNLRNLESREEGSLATRYGLAALSTDGVKNNYPLGAPAQSLGRMRGLSSPYNYAIGGTVLYRKEGDARGRYLSIGTVLSGGRVSMVPYRPDASSSPWMFFADAGRLLKDSGVLSDAQNWGITPPTTPALIAPSVSGLTDIELFDEGSTASFTLTGVGGPAMAGRISDAIPAIVATGTQLVPFNPVAATTVVRAGSVATVTCSAAHHYVDGMRVTCTAITGDQTLLASSVVINVIDATHFSYPSPGANTTGTIGTFTAFPSYQVGMSVTTQDGPAETVYITEVTTLGWVATFTKTHAANVVVSGNYLTGTVSANSTGSVSKSIPLNLSFSTLQTNPDDNVVQLFLFVANPLSVREIKIIVDVGDGSFAQDYFYKSIVMSPAQTNVAGNVTSDVAQPGSVFLRAGGRLDPRTVGGKDPSILPSDLPLLQQMQPVSMNAGQNVWTLIQARIGEFVSVGAAGNPGTSWPNVKAWKIQILSSPNTAVTFGVDDLAFVGGSDLDSFGGQEYDYRYTYYNANTGCESGPSQMMVATDPSTFKTTLGAAFLPVPVAVQRQAIQVEMQQATDTQVTHFRLYRRGGTLTQAWYMVAQVAGGGTGGAPGIITYADTIADSVIEVNQLLNVNADPPVTTLLPVPLNITISIAAGSYSGPGVSSWTYPVGTTLKVGQKVTIDVGNSQEQTVVSAVDTVNRLVTMYLQLPHGTGAGRLTTALSADTSPQTAMNLMAIAFDKAWLAGDPNNPHMLYYSATFSPETFPVQNSLEIGTPDAPIMALVELNGLLFVFTTKRVYQVLGAGSAVPTVIPTSVKHGLVAKFAWCVSENAIYYLSYDGIYVFTGGSAVYITEPVEWIWTAKNLGPIPAIAPAQKPNVFMAYCNHEVYVAYTDLQGVTHRLIYHDVYRRWRPDDYLTGSITAQYFAEDAGIFVVAKSDSMIYQDRVNDFDSGGWNGQGQIKNAIPFTLQTAQMDQSEADASYAKRSKIYNELTLDADLGTQTVSVALVFNSGKTIIPMGTLIGGGTGRRQYQMNINDGDGFESPNVGLLLTGSVTGIITLFEIHIRAAGQAESRRSWDTWWLGYGSDEWHLYKQVFAEYRAIDSSGILVNVFTDGNMTAPKYRFVMPQTMGLIGGVSSLTFADSGGHLWLVTLQDSGILQKAPTTGGAPQTIFLNDLDGITSWQLAVNVAGQMAPVKVAYNGAYPSKIMLISMSGLQSTMTITNGILNQTTPALVFSHRISKKFRLPAIKCRQIRFVGTSLSDFHLYDDTQIEHKKLGSAKGYERGKIAP